tara:strand:- start:184 stop:528 length:345 start_codon:yes stop_codon:yes gene_type:complete
MSIKLTLLKSGETLISETKELVSDEKQTAPHAYLLENPQIVKTREKTFLTEEEKSKGDYGIDVILTPWIILTSDKSIVLPTDWVVTIVEPLPSVKQMYIDKSETFKIKETDDGD